jgi:hypothetical protein
LKFDNGDPVCEKQQKEFKFGVTIKFDYRINS